MSTTRTVEALTLLILILLILLGITIAVVTVMMDGPRLRLSLAHGDGIGQRADFRVQIVPISRGIDNANLAAIYVVDDGRIAEGKLEVGVSVAAEHRPPSAQRFQFAYIGIVADHIGNRRHQLWPVAFDAGNSDQHLFLWRNDRMHAGEVWAHYVLHLPADGKRIAQVNIAASRQEERGQQQREHNRTHKSSSHAREVAAFALSLSIVRWQCLQTADPTLTGSEQYGHSIKTAPTGFGDGLSFHASTNPIARPIKKTVVASIDLSKASEIVRASELAVNNISTRRAA